MAVIDVNLTVGDTSQSVEVTAEASLLNTENSSLGQAISTKEVAELPINGRTPMVAAALAIGVIGYAQPTLIHPFDAGAAAGWSVAGAYTQTSELLVNGSPNATWDGRLAFSPPQDAVQEVRIMASDTDAAFGHTAGGTLNQITKTGTNALHGSAWEFNQPNTLTAIDFFNNQARKPRPVTHLNQYGLTAGGPVWIPKAIDTRNKLFWFFAWETMKDAQPNPYTTTVPTDLERIGDFSGILAADKTVIYDPYSAVKTGSVINRTPFSNNKIPHLANSVSNPFFGLANTSVSANTSASVAQLLARFPEFPVGDTASGWNGSGGVLEQNLNAGISYFNSLNVRVQKRLSHGLSFTFNYIHSKLIERVTWLNDSDPAPEKRISPIDHPNRIVTAVTYEVPFGRDRLVKLQSRLVNGLFGGWVLNSVYTYQTGGPVMWTNGSTTSPGDYVYFGAPIVLDNRMADPGMPAFNIGAFDTKSADAFNYHIRTFPTAISNLRVDVINQWDPSLLKRFQFTERGYFQLRFEFFNLDPAVSRNAGLWMILVCIRAWL
jgi:hypothetical protein